MTTRRFGVGAARARLRRAGHVFLGPDDFTALLLSRRDLARVADSIARLHGLVDRQSGQTYWIAAEELVTTEIG